jgi:uncharacterized protein (TIGR00290 family)
MKQLLFCWSGGKDSSMALHRLQVTGEYEVVGLLTTVTEAYDRISMHGVRRSLLRQQCESIGLPLHEIALSANADNEEYESKMKGSMLEWKAKGIATIGFGDIFLEDLKRYREENLAKVGMKPHFPLWKRNTAELARQFVRVGFKAVLTCVNPKELDSSFAGRVIDDQFLDDLPDSVDPCGENGEYHSFVYEGPIYSEPIAIEVGQVVERNGFTFCDITPAQQAATDNPRLAK